MLRTQTFVPTSELKISESAWLKTLLICGSAGIKILAYDFRQVGSWKKGFWPNEINDNPYLGADCAVG